MINEWRCEKRSRASIARLREVKVDEPSIRRLFHERRYLERWFAGELLCCLRKERPAAPEANQPPGTRSMLIGFVDRRGVRVCLVHMFFTPAGTIGGSGRPDPKEIVDETHIFKFSRKSGVRWP